MTEIGDRRIVPPLHGIVFVAITLVAMTVQILLPFLAEQWDWRLSRRALFWGVLIFQGIGVVLLLILKSPVWTFGSLFLLWFLTAYIPIPTSVYFLGLTIASTAVLLIQIVFPSLRKLRKWITPGKIDQPTMWLMLLAVGLSTAGLLIWTAIVRPDLGNVVRHLPDKSLPVMFLLLIGFSVLNALGEELAFRGIFYYGLSHCFKKPIIVITIQAVVFGLIHLKGFPNGVSGMILAGLYGFGLGLIRWKSKGLIAPFIAHIIADLVIGLIVLKAAGRI